MTHTSTTLILLAALAGCVDDYAEDWDGDGYTASEECDDQRSDSFPGADELCDGRDNDCDLAIDEGPADGTACRPFPSTDRRLFLGPTAACSLDLAGAAVCWGDSPATEPPSETWAQLALAADYACGLSTDGVATCWGDVPTTLRSPPMGRYVAIAVQDVPQFGEFACVGDHAGEVTCWGAHGTFDEAPDVPLSAFALADDGICGIDADAEIRCFAHISLQSEPVPSGVPVSIVGGLEHFCVLGDTGQATCSGLGVGARATPPAAPLLALSAGVDHTCGLHDDYLSSCWGTDDESRVRVPEGLELLHIAAGDSVSCGIDLDEQITCWGDEESPVLEVPETW